MANVSNASLQQSEDPILKYAVERGITLAEAKAELFEQAKRATAEQRQLAEDLNDETLDAGYASLAESLGRGIEDVKAGRLRPLANVTDKTPTYQLKDSGVREEYASGMVRDTEQGKARFDLLHPIGVPYEEQFLTRFATHMAKGAEKYGDRNWEKAEGQEELARYKSSALRHLVQWVCDKRDEDHASAVAFNLMAAEFVKYWMAIKAETLFGGEPSE